MFMKSNLIFVIVSISLLSSSLCKNELKTKQVVSNPFPFLRSAEGIVRIDLTFVNNRSFSVRVYWVNYQGNLEFYLNLAPGQSGTIQGYYTQPWVWISEYGNYSGYFIPSSSPQQTLYI